MSPPAARRFMVDASWAALLRDLGLRPADMLRRAGLPEDLLSRPQAGLATRDYFDFWHALETAVGDPRFPLRLVDAVTAEVFSPPLFAALCSADLAQALQRLALHKRLIAPMALDVERHRDGRLTVRPRWTEAPDPPPLSLQLAELAFFLRLGRLGTREPLRALQFSLPEAPPALDAVTDWFGVAPRIGEPAAIGFAAADAERPFLTANPAMWRVFEPELRRQLDELDASATLGELDASATLGERVRALLLEALPGGRVDVDVIASRLALSRRTLQRRLGEEGLSFQALVARTREDLARHYLARTRLPHAEISFLLGFEDPNSFYRAFQAWTGSTPERWRLEH